VVVSPIVLLRIRVAVEAQRSPALVQPCQARVMNWTTLKGYSNSTNREYVEKSSMIDKHTGLTLYLLGNTLKGGFVY
jgi:hypothetical protein